MRVTLVLQLVGLLTVANGVPVLAKRLFGARGAYPLDGGVRWVDRRPLFGASKTVRGVVLSIVATTIAAPAFGLPWQHGVLIASAAMAGDLFSSFVKRRLRLASGSRATGLDQIPESLLPLLAVAHALALSVVEITAGAAVFLVGEICVSRVLYRLHVRDRPY